MQHTITRSEKGKVEIKVDVSAADFNKAYEQALKELEKDVKVDGFRPGNVPAEILENKLGGSKILNEAANILVSKHLAEIFAKEDIVPIVNPKVAVNSLGKSEPFSFTAEVSGRPKVKLGDWKKIQAKKIKVKEVTEADIGDSINNIFEAWKKQKSQSQSEESKSDEAEGTGKFIYDAHGNKVFFDDKKTLQSSSNQDSTAGLKIPIKDDQPSSSPGLEHGGINDEFAKKIGARDLVHLQELVKKDLESIVADQVESKFEEEIFDEILKLGEIEVPDILVDDEVNRIMVRINQNLEQQGKKMEDFIAEENTTVDAMRAKLREQAEKNVKVTLLMDEIGKQADIKISKEEIEEAAKKVDTANITPDQRVDLERYLTVSLFQTKTLDLVKKTIATAPSK